MHTLKTLHLDIATSPPSLWWCPPAKNTTSGVTSYGLPPFSFSNQLWCACTDRHSFNSSSMAISFQNKSRGPVHITTENIPWASRVNYLVTQPYVKCEIQEIVHNTPTYFNSPIYHKNISHGLANISTNLGLLER